MSPMTSSFWRYLAVMAALCSLCLAGTQLEFTSTPKVITTGITKSVQLHCSVSDTDKRAEYLPEDLDAMASMFVSNKDGQTVARVHAGGAQVLLTKGGLTATGSLTGSPHLTLTFAHPAEMDLGVYKCKMHGFSTANRDIDLVKSLTVKTSGPSISDVIASFKSDMAKQQGEINKLAECASAHVGFTARYRLSSAHYPLSSYSNKIQANKQVKYEDVVENTNGDYNPKTGTFTCSIPGLYQFDLHVKGSDFNNYAWLRLVHNDQRLTEAMKGVGNHMSASTTDVVRLAKGDTVKVVTYEVSVIHEYPGGG